MHNEEIVLKKLPIPPLLSIAAVLMAPAVAQAQATSTPQHPEHAHPAPASTPSHPERHHPSGRLGGAEHLPRRRRPSRPTARAARRRDIFQIRVGAGMEYDDNVLRVANDDLGHGRCSDPWA